MQEAFEAQRDTLICPQLLTLEAQKEKLKCPHQIQAFSVCIDPQCQVAGLMCRDPSCNCINTHYKCHHIQLNRVLDSIDKHQKQIPQAVRKSYKTTNQIINAMIDQLSRVRRKLYLQERYFGLTKQELSFMALIDDQKIDKISGKIISELEKTFEAQISFAIDNQQDILKDFKLKRIEFDSLCKYIQQNYAKYDLKQQYKKFLRGSKIVNQPNEIELMHKWMLQTLTNHNFSSKLLFRASQNNFSAAEFHKHCDGFENTLVIAKTEFDKVIGGFTPNKWYSPNSNEYVKDEGGKSFVFSLTLKEKYKCTNPQKSILCSKSYGPTFGGQNTDILLGDNCFTNNSCYGNFPSCYNLQLNGTNKYQNNQQSKTLLSGATDGMQFKVKQYQVYQIKWS